MVKDIDINVTYNGMNCIINCQPSEFPVKIYEKFNVNVNDVSLYSVVGKQRQKIIPQQVKHLMKILMVPKEIDKRTLRSYFENNPNKSFDGIIKKLTDNSTLTGLERKSLIEFIEKHSSPTCCKKRKLNGNNNEVDLVPKKVTEMVHKKVQVNVKLINLKESVAQTDPVNLALDKSSNSPDICHQMKRLAHDNASTEEAKLLMKKSFDDRRKYIFLESPPVALVKEKYELLFTIHEVKREIDRLYYPDKCAEILKNMEIYAPIILKHCKPSDEIFLRTKKNMDRVQTAHQKKYAQIVGSVFALATLLEEEFRFIHLNDYPHGSEDMYPYIDASCYSLKQLFFDNILYHVYVEGILLCDAEDLPEAVLCLMGAFFIFNIDYPASCRRTLTAFEKLYLCASDTKDLDEITEQMIKYLQLQAQAKLGEN